MPSSSSSSELQAQGLAPKKLELQGPRPAPLKVNKDSHGIRKPPIPPKNRSPVIIYLRSPKIIHTKAHEFMALVQRLTGKSPNAPAPNASLPPLPPSAPVAAATKASPTAPSMSPMTYSPYLGPSPFEHGALLNMDITREQVIDIERLLSDDIVIDTKPAQMVPPNGVLSPPPSFLSQPSVNSFLPSPKTSLQSPNLFELSPLLYTPSFRDALFLSPLQRSIGSTPLTSGHGSSFMESCLSDLFRIQ
ncbi:unnamed protein product [Victoria cruziana]